MQNLASALSALNTAKAEVRLKGLLHLVHFRFHEKVIVGDTLLYTARLRAPTEVASRKAMVPWALQSDMPRGMLHYENGSLNMELLGS